MMHTHRSPQPKNHRRPRLGPSTQLLLQNRAAGPPPPKPQPLANPSLGGGSTPCRNHPWVLKAAVEKADAQRKRLGLGVSGGRGGVVQSNGSHTRQRTPLRRQTTVGRRAARSSGPMGGRRCLEQAGGLLALLLGLPVALLWTGYCAQPRMHALPALTTLEVRPVVACRCAV